MMRSTVYACLVGTLLVAHPCFSFVTPHHSQKRASLLWGSTPEPLAEEGTWEAFLDEETTGLVYYFDSETGESLWEPPTSTFPQIRLPRKKQREMEDLRRKYRQSRQKEEPKAQVKKEEKESKKEMPDWIGGLMEKTAPEEKEAEKTETEEKKAGLFDSFVGKIADQMSTKDDDDGVELQQGETLVKRGKSDEENETKGGIFSGFSGMTKPASKKEDQEASTKKPEEKKKVEVKPAKPQLLKIDMGYHVQPHPAKVLWGGEDAVFTKGRTFGVFDGVSGAEKLDGVPLYSKTLANQMKKSIGTKSVSVQEMTKALTEAANYADSSATGASTAVVASIAENGFLQALNVGDSYCMVVRNGKVTAKTREISHYWECPYQLSDDSPDRPRDGTKLNVELIPGDVIVMGSDGVFDNVDDDMILESVSKAPNAKANQMARKICDISFKQSMDKNSVTPYAKQAQRRGDPDYEGGVGGKVDDISCVVVRCN